jgi:AraC-like DNA-binding protein
MKISVVDKGSGIIQQFAGALGAKVDGRIAYIPESKGSGYLTGFGWGRDLRMMIRNYHLNEDVVIERTNELAEDQDDIIFLLTGVFPTFLSKSQTIQPERANMMICKHAVSSILSMPKDTMFGSVTIAVSREYLSLLFGQINHPVVESVLEAGDNFVFETGITPAVIKTANDLLDQSISVSLESHYYKLKCEELLCHIFNLLMERNAVPASGIHINDIKAIYGIKSKMLLHLNVPPNIASLSKDAGMSEPKLRKLFKQTFDKGVFEYYQYARMLQAARLLREKHLSVSEVGYQLGFTNLSHFSKVFEEHFGLKPKKYSMQ